MTTREFLTLDHGDKVRDERGWWYRVWRTVRDGNHRLYSVTVRTWVDNSGVEITADNCAGYTLARTEM
jgi:hypothetical protein